MTYSLTFRHRTVYRTNNPFIGIPMMGAMLVIVLVSFLVLLVPGLVIALVQKIFTGRQTVFTLTTTRTTHPPPATRYHPQRCAGRTGYHSRLLPVRIGG